MLTLFLSVIVSQATPAPPGPLKVAATDLTFVGLDPKLGAVFQERFVSRLGNAQLKVTTPRDIQQLLGLERERQLLACDTGGSQCIAELAGALGVEVVIGGSLAKSESGFIITLRALKADTGQTLATPNARVSTEGALLDWLDATADVLRDQLLATLRPSTAVVTSTAVTSPAAAAPLSHWVPAIAGGALVLGGGICLGISGGNYLRLTGQRPPAPEQITDVKNVGKLMTPVGAVLAGVGVVGIVTSLIWSATWQKPVKAAVVPLRDGAVFTFGGDLP